MMLRERTMKVLLLLVCMTGIVFAGLTGLGAQDDAQARIENAMSAAPLAIAKDATILDSAEDGSMITLREGTNGWTCFPDYPGSPGNDPSCLDTVWMAWNDALAAKEEPNVTVPGLAYMLQGGSDSSNEDPYAPEPTNDADWIRTAPHVMIVLPGKLDMELFTTDHHYGGPYIMWAGTPYEHIMMPVDAVEVAQ